MIVDINGKKELCHCPSTGRIGNIIFNNIPCLLSKSNNRKRKTKFTVEAISLDKVTKKNKSWIGINQSKANKYIKFFFQNNLLPKIVDKPKKIKSEVKLGTSRIDLLIDNTYIEIKTPLINIPSGNREKREVESKFNSFDRLIRHYDELAKNRGILIICYMYNAKRFVAPKLDKTNKAIVSAVRKAILKGVSNWQINLRIDKKGVRIISGVRLPNGLDLGEKLSEPILTPTTKSEHGHDIEISREEAVSRKLVDAREWTELEEACFNLYNFYSKEAMKRKIIVADVKFEFGRYKEGLIQIDEAPTHDSARLWPLKYYFPGKFQEAHCLDKEFLRSYLLKIGYKGNNVPPHLPWPLIRQIALRVRGAYEVLTGKKTVDELNLMDLDKLFEFLRR